MSYRFLRPSCQANWSTATIARDAAPIDPSYNATKRNAEVCMMMAPSPAGFDVVRDLAQKQFSWMDVTTYWFCPIVKFSEWSLFLLTKSTNWLTSVGTALIPSCYDRKQARWCIWIIVNKQSSLQWFTGRRADVNGSPFLPSFVYKTPVHLFHQALIRHRKKLITIW